MTIIDIKLHTLAQAIADAELCLKGLLQVYDEIDQTVPRLRATWEGQGRQSWDQLQRNWSQAHAAAHTAGVNLRTAMEAAYDNYLGTDRSMSQVFGG